MMGQTCWQALIVVFSRQLKDSLGAGYLKSRVESLKPGSVIATIVLEYKDDAKRSISDIMEDIWFKLLFGDPNLLSINPTALIISDMSNSFAPEPKRVERLF